VTYFGRVLVAIDGSEAAEKALRRAAQGARALGMKLHLISVAEMPFIPDISIGGVLGDMGAYQEGLEEILAEARTEAEEHGAEVEDAVVLQGSPAEAIIDRAEEVGYDYIVLGRRGRGLPVRFRLGSTTHKVTAYAPCAVTIVPQDDDPDLELGRVLVATDGSEVAEKAVGRAIQLAGAFGKELHLVAVAQQVPVSAGDAMATVFERQHEVLEQLIERDVRWARSEGVEVGEGAVLEGNAADALLRRIEEVGYDFAVLGRRGAGITSRFRLGSTTHKVISYAPCKVVVVTPKDPWRLERREEEE
jgi:nucleotide-binding universal stress UspA family protein